MEFHHGHDQFLEDSNINGFGIDENTLLCTTFLESSSYNNEDFCMPPFINFDTQTLNCFSSSSSSYGHDQHYINPPNYDYEQLFAVPNDHDHNIKLECSPLMVDQDYYSMFALLVDDDVHENYCHDNHLVVNKQQEPQPSFEIGKGKGKKKMMSKLSLVDDVKGGIGSGGQPSKNLMAERRRRKRLNDRLSMLRSIVPNITKMDRTSILGDTIDYIRELIQKINHMQQQQMDHETSTHQLSNAKPLPKFITNSPKFEVERRNRDTVDVKICCTGKPEVLISTITTLEAFGLQIHESVITCFNNDFEMHASCTPSHSQVQEQSVMQDTEDIKQALFRSAGYGGN